MKAKLLGMGASMLVLLAPAFVRAQEIAAEPEASPPPVVETIPVDSTEAPDAEQTKRPAVANRLIEEIVVTAQKREENLQDVPISVQAFSGDALAARGVQDTYDLGQSVPGLQFSGVAGFTLIFMRGIGTDNFIPSADPSVATYVDGMYTPAGQSTATSLGSIARVEVLKGPQGTLFGRNATGGAISVITQDPGDSFSANAELEAGNFDLRSVKLGVSGPITDWFSAGLSGIASYKDSYYTNNNYEVERDELEAVRLKLAFRPFDDLLLALTAYHSDQQGVGSTIGVNTTPSRLGMAAGIMPGKDGYVSDGDFPGSARGSQDFYYGHLTWNLPWLDLKLLGSHQEVSQEFAATDFDGSPVPIAAFDTTNEYIKLETAELQFVSNDETPGAESFEWVAGLYYLHSVAGFDPAHLFAAPGGLTSAAALAGVTIPPEFLALLAMAPTGNTPLGPDGVSVELRGLMETDSYSAFAQGTYTFTDWLDLTLGGRYQSEKRFLIKSSTAVLNPIPGVFDPTIPFDLPPSETAKNFSPKAVLSFRPREDALVYASYSVGFKSGTFNIINIYVPPNYIVPEEVTTYELGAKMDFLDGRLRVNGALFYNEIDDLQSGFVSVQSGGAVRFVTAGAARTRGAELDGTWLPLPELNPGLALSGNVAYVDAIYTEFENGSGFTEGEGVYQEGQDFSDNEIVRSPKWSGGIGVVQTVSAPRGSFEIGVDTYYNSGFFYDPMNTVEEDSYTLLNGRLSYLHDPWNLRLTVFGKNLTEEEYHLQQFQTDFGIIKTLAPPREYGLRLSWDF